MRFFLVSYTAAVGPDNNLVNGNAWFNHDRFPSNKELKEAILPACAAGNAIFDLKGITVMNIFEFKSEEDYDAFRDESPISDEFLRSIN